MKKKILIVDDDRLNLTFLQAGLVQNGYEVCMAQDGEEAIQSVKIEKPDAIVLDIQMPKMNGYDFLQELQMMPEKRIPIIMLTANENMQDVFVMESVRGYLVKPVNLEQLKQKLGSCLA